MDSYAPGINVTACPGHHMDNSFSFAPSFGCLAITAAEDNADKSTACKIKTL